MVSNPVKGPSPSDPIKGSSDETKTSSSPHRKIEKVEKVGEVDPEQQSRARKFRAFVEEDSTQEQPDSTHPSPIHLFSGSDKQGSAKPSYSSSDAPPKAAPTPTKQEAEPEAEQKADEPPLPRSDDFWSDIDEPIQEKPKHPKLIEKTALSSPKSEGAKKKKDEFFPSAHLGIPIKEPSFSKPTHPAFKEVKEEEETLPEPLQKSKSEKLPPKAPSSPMARSLNEKEQKIGSSFAEDRPKHLESDKLTKKESPKEKPPLKQENKEAIQSPFSQAKKKEAKNQKKEEVSEEIQPPSIQTLPAEIVPTATAATLAATPYLHPDTMSLFYQMVGTIYIMSAPPGISRTEIVLNAPSYAQSKFYGASIIIEKYATAPNSFNIRLTGSNEAVSLFNQNIPSLAAAFQRGKFSFGIGRIEAEYKNEKPLFRRKEKSKQTDLGGDFEGKER